MAYLQVVMRMSASAPRAGDLGRQFAVMNSDFALAGHDRDLSLASVGDVGDDGVPLRDLRVRVSLPGDERSDRRHPGRCASRGRDESTPGELTHGVPLCLMVSSSPGSAIAHFAIRDETSSVAMPVNLTPISLYASQEMPDHRPADVRARRCAGRGTVALL